MANGPTAKRMVRLFQALGDLTRLRLLNLMKDEEVCVCFFVETLDARQPKISRHLAYLRKAGLVEARRDGKWMHYRLVEPEDPQVAEVLRSVLSWAGADSDLQQDRKRYKEVCCSLEQPLVRLKSGARPDKVHA